MAIDKSKLIEFLESMVNDEPDKNWDDYDRGLYDGEQDTINNLIRSINDGKYGK